MELFSQYAVAAAMEAMEDAGLVMEQEDRFRVGVIVGSGVGSLQITAEAEDKLKEKGISRYELANRINVTYPTIDKIYKGKSTSIKFENLESICKELNCSLDDILIFEDNDMREQQQRRLVAYHNAFQKMLNKGDTK